MTAALLLGPASLLRYSSYALSTSSLCLLWRSPQLRMNPAVLLAVYNVPAKAEKEDLVSILVVVHEEDGSASCTMFLLTVLCR